MPKQQNFFYSQPSTLPGEAAAKFYLSTTFCLSFMIGSVAPTRTWTFYAYLITKIGNGNLKAYMEFLKTQSSRGLLVAISHEIFVRNHSNFDTKCQMIQERRTLITIY